MLNRVSWPKEISLTAMVIVVALATRVASTSAQPSRPDVARLDRIANSVTRVESKAGFDRGRLYGVSRNLTAFADRWRALRNRPIQTGTAEPATSGVEASGKPISRPTLNLGRFAGFTQSQTSTAWCGSSVLTFFNDTGSEARTITALAGITAVGFASSSNLGKGFAYQGAPPGGVNFDQTLLGSPTVACLDQSRFFYSAIWLDTLNNITGVAFAHSADGGHTFSTPIVAASKSASTDFVDHAWLAIDRVHSTMYIAYADLDYSGLACGTDPNTGSTIPRYAIELVVSTDAGATWSAGPTIIEQVCADAADPWATVMGPQVAIGLAGEVYVAFEAAGEDGGGITSRQIKIARSNDSGVTFAPAVVVAPVNPVGDGADLQGFVRSNEFPGIAIGRGKKNPGFVYLAWNDGDNSVPDSFTTLGTYNFADIKMSVSQDAGNTWQAPVRVNNNAKGGAAPLTDQFEPAIATDKTGTIAICFYDRRRDVNNFKIDRECAKSANGGTTWVNRKLTAASFPTEVGQDLFVAPDYMGDFDTVATDSTGAHAGFLDAFANNGAGNPNVMVDQP